jgi:alpha-galactosidase
VRPQGSGRASSPQHSAPFFDAINSPEGQLMDGAWLSQAGLPMPRANAETAFIVHLERV